MERDYDSIIKEHYKKVAEKNKLLSTSTMTDKITRRTETDAIICYIRYIRQILRTDSDNILTILDTGCGNGYTLEELYKNFPNQYYIGVEKSDDLRYLAESRFNNINNVNIIKGDIRDKDFINSHIDILICQRVIINLLLKDDQYLAVNNIIDKVRIGGHLIFIEAFKEPLKNLNVARDEFNLLHIKPAYHNLYLDEDIFIRSDIKRIEYNELPPDNFLSTHYFVTRVFNQIFLPISKQFKRNSEFSQFFSKALNPFIGDYSPIKLYVFKKI